MEGFVVSLLIVVLVLILFQHILDAIGLEPTARKSLWIVALVVSIIWLIRGVI